MIERHPAGRSCALVLFAAGVLTATIVGGIYGVAATIGHTGETPVIHAPLPVVQAVPGTTTATTTLVPPAATTAPNSAPAARAAVQETTVTEPAPVETTPEYIDLGSGVTQRVAPPAKPPTPPPPPGPENGWDPTANGGKGGPIGPDPATAPTR